MSKNAKKKKRAQKKALKKKAAFTKPSEPVLQTQPPEKKEKQLTKKLKEIKNTFKEKKTKIFESPNKLRAIIMIFGSVMTALLIQYYVFTGFNPEMIQTNIAQIKSLAQETYKLNNAFDLIDTEKNNSGHYIASGEKDKDVFSFALQSKEKTIVLHEVILTKTGGTPDNFLSTVKLYEGENVIAQTQGKNGKFTFNQFTSVLQPNTNKNYVFKADVADNALPGNRFKFSIELPTDLTVLIDDKELYGLDTYPFAGAYVSIVGWRKK